MPRVNDNATYCHRGNGWLMYGAENFFFLRKKDVLVMYHLIRRDPLGLYYG
jgi:hypothetical protein